MLEHAPRPTLARLADDAHFFLGSPEYLIDDHGSVDGVDGNAGEPDADSEDYPPSFDTYGTSPSFAAHNRSLKILLLIVTPIVLLITTLILLLKPLPFNPASNTAHHV